ncbi:MAG: hypothetical protein JNJ54_36150 [Myxococcaceae bacterium]|nr:hypothetical protein [Myxococcaceae bacterium]
MRIFGQALDVDALLRAVPLRAAAVHRRGEPRLKTKPHWALLTGSTINVTVSDAAFSDRQGQVRDPLEDRDVAFQSDTFPAALLGELGALGIDLEVSRYRHSE